MAHIDTYAIGNSSYSICPDWGCNMFSWVVEGRELMYCPPDLPHNAQKITGGGNPLLFPAVGRTWDRSSGEPVPGVYRIFGHQKQYFMPSHGILFLCSFEKKDEIKTPDAVSVSYELIVPEKVHEENYPFDVQFTQKFVLKPGVVEMEMSAQNNGNSPAPAAFGYHPYFKISNAKREGVEVCLPITKYLHTTKDTVLLTGESEDASGNIKLEPDVYYDHVFSGINGSRMSLIDRAAGQKINVDFDDKTELLLLYTPNDTEFVCIEPWTRGLGAYEYLREPNWEKDDRIPVIEPGDTFVYRARFSADFI